MLRYSEASGIEQRTAQILADPLARAPLYAQDDNLRKAKR